MNTRRPFVLHGAWQRVVDGDVLGPLDTSSSATTGHVVGQADAVRWTGVEPRELDLQAHSKSDRCSFKGGRRY